MGTGGTAERIASAARAILLAEGAAAVSMRRVADAVGITPMAIYSHYPNRDALLRAVADASFLEVAGNWGRRAETSDLRARVFGLLDDLLDFALGQPHLYNFLIADRRESARRFPDDFRDGGSPTFSPILALVDLGMREGLLRRDDPLEVALIFTSSAQGLIQLYLSGRIGLSEKDFRALCARTVGRILDGLET
ncbi:TetR/AcrR family transcriptional regulator [Lentzea sp. NEAU-D13]|uniref:TetR/AcrR family transcriptional regulator n=1 Tax=Lentzea alba TaxID=2714351 RepID=A0A7C9RUP6_9PSEU|nr:TetR/AcrR family transcriptional regulator [Lentzea alba]NGY63309.1 TetR/AcrR family transcriptional regulator [Lentzea alba]